jgi:hypothetical protein
VWVLPEEVRVRRAVGEGVSRGLRDVYTEHKAEPVPEHIRELLLLMEQVPPLRYGSAVLKGQREDDEPDRQAIWSADGLARSFHN